MLQITPRYASTLFVKLFESLPDAILVAGVDGLIFEINPQTERLFGYSREELVGSSIEMLVPERFRKHHSQLRGTFHSDPRIRPMGAGLELFGVRKDGTEFPLDIMLSPVQAEGENLVLVVVRDITARKAAAEALRRHEEQFRLMVQGTRDYAIFMLDPNGNVMTWNPGAQAIKGYREDEILGQHFSRFYTQEEIDRGKPANCLETARASGRYEEEGWRVRKDGSRLWANVIITALHDDKGQLIGFCKVTRDFTNRKRAEDSLLQELGKALFSSSDIRQIFTAIEDSIQNLAPHDCANITLYDEQINQLRVQELFTRKAAAKQEETLLAIEDTAEGWVFQHGQPLFSNQLTPDSPRIDLGISHLGTDLRSGCWLPLKHNERTIGTLFIGSQGESSFDPKDSELLLRIAAQIAAAVDNVHSSQRISALSEKLSAEKRYLEEELRTEYSFEEIVGQSLGLKRVLKQVETVASTDATALILGETGTGKELIARAIHNLSPRRERTFVKLNCAAIPLGLLESELFGHEKGAFTGAIAQRVGRLELAHQGTLFLDEIGDLPLELQPKLLRALQEKEIERLGGRRTIPVDVRLIAATNRDLEKMVKEGQFRSDLYYRLKVFPISIPPLRQRREDIPLLVNYFTTKHARRMNKHVQTIPPDVMSALTNWHWPGNIRELENFLERAVILTQGPALRAPLAELELPEEEPEELDDSEEATNPDYRTAEREHILRVLRQTKGVIGGPGGAAEKLGLKRTTLNSKLKKLKIEKKDYL